MVTIGSAEYQITVDNAQFKKGLTDAERDAAAASGKIGAAISKAAGGFQQAAQSTQLFGREVRSIQALAPFERAILQAKQFGQAAQQAGQQARAAAQAAGGLGGGLDSRLSASVGGLGGIGAAISSALGSAPAAVASALGGISTAVRSALGNVVSTVTSTLGGVPAAINSALGGAPAAAASALGGVASAVRSGLGGVVSTVASSLSGVTSTITSAFGGATAAVTSGLSGIGSAVSSAFSGVTSSISSALSGIGSTISSSLAPAAKGLSTAFDSSSASIVASFSKIGTAAAATGAAIALGLGLGVKAAADLEQAVANISSIKPEVDTRALAKTLSDLSTKTPATAKEIADSLYDIFSSVDVTVEEGVKLVEIFSKGSVGALTDAQTFGTAIVGVMNAYKLSLADATHITDLFFNTVKAGVVTGQELATGLGTVVAAGKAAGASVEEVFALVVGVTKEGGTAAQNINNLVNLFSKINTTEAQKDIHALGVATVDLAGKFRPTIDVIADLKVKLDAMTKSAASSALQEIFPDIQARQAAQTLLNEIDAVRKATEENRTATGSAEAAYEKMVNTFNSQGKILINSLVSIGQTIGAAILPALTPAIKALAEDLPAAFNAASDAAAPFGDAISEAFSTLTSAAQGGGFSGFAGAIRTMVEDIDVNTLSASIKKLFGDLTVKINEIIGAIDGTSVGNALGDLLIAAFELAFKAVELEDAFINGLANFLINIEWLKLDDALAKAFVALLNRAWDAATGGFRPRLPDVFADIFGPRPATPSSSEESSSVIGPATAEKAAKAAAALAAEVKATEAAIKEKAAIVAAGEKEQTAIVAAGVGTRGAILQRDSAEEKEIAKETINAQIKAWEDGKTAAVDSLREQKDAVTAAAATQKQAIEDARDADLAAIDVRKQATDDYYVSQIRSAERARDAELQNIQDRKDASLRAIEDEKRALDAGRRVEDRTTEDRRESETRGLEALTEAAERNTDAALRGIEREKDAALRGIDERIDAEDRRHSDAMQNLDDEEQRQLGVIDDQLRKLDAAQQKEQRQETDRSLARSLADAKNDVKRAKTPAEKSRAERAVGDAERAISRERRSRQRDDARAELRDKADAIRKEFGLRKKAESDKNKLAKDGLSDEKQVITDRAKLQSDSLKEALEQFKLDQKSRLQALKDRYEEEDRLTADRRQKEDEGLEARKRAVQDQAEAETRAIREQTQHVIDGLREQQQGWDRHYAALKVKVRADADFKIRELQRVTRGQILELDRQIKEHERAAKRMVDIWRAALNNIKGFVRAELKVTYFQAPTGSNVQSGTGAGLTNTKEDRTAGGPRQFTDTSDAGTIAGRYDPQSGKFYDLNGREITVTDEQRRRILTQLGIPARALGGGVKRDEPYFVGERGPELFVPKQDGEIVDAAKTAALMGPAPALLSAGYAAGAQRGWDGASSGPSYASHASTATTVNATFNIDAAGQNGEQLAREIAGRLEPLLVAKAVQGTVRLLDQTEKMHAEGVDRRLGMAT